MFLYRSLGWDGSGRTLGNRVLLFSDARAVYIDRDGRRKAVVGGRFHFGIVRHSKPDRDTLNREQTTLYRTWSGAGPTLNRNRGVAENGCVSANRNSTILLIVEGVY